MKPKKKPVSALTLSKLINRYRGLIKKRCWAATTETVLTELEAVQKGDSGG